MPLDPAGEARARLGSGYEPRVLEPSPPAVNAPPWFADDPTAAGVVPAGRVLVSPLDPAPAGAVSWQSLCAGNADLARWCAPRWLGGWARLGDLPPSLAVTRSALHGLAEYVLAPARYAANGRIGLRWTHGGFGTPFYGDDRQVRVEGSDVVAVVAGTVRRETATTLRRAATLAEVAPAPVTAVYRPTTVADPDAELELDRGCVEAIGDWFGFATSVLEQLRAGAGAADAATRTQLWPEHFDVAIETGDGESGQRASYGASPGDDDHAEPYLYVAPWVRPLPPGDWNDPAFPGASMPYARLRDAADQRAAALAFYRRHRAFLSGR